MQWVESYLPFGGRLLNDPRTANNRQWFQDKPQDAESGLSYFGARYYDPAIGRFMATDPQGYDEANLHSFNRYTYGNNNPYRYTDPDGHSPIDIAFLVVDGVQLGRAIYSGAGTTEAAINFGMSAVGVISPVPGVGLALKEVSAVVHAADAIKEAGHAEEAVRIVEKGSEAAGAVKKVHANKVDDRPATLYKKYDREGNFEKHGITKHEDPSKRYTRKEIDGGRVDFEARGPRREMIKEERNRVETNPGPKNKEPWAGKRNNGGGE